ncbi:MAG: hypothetical protein CVU40_05770 [Chloroflexi bacterium HGW-Chloroflexi-2]|jgi:hypothetical protein|nr:MAG: hypothetical protein CVU40_05770 [Chloroflexi bacterium HGW-Chloroflexi-2]
MSKTNTQTKTKQPAPPKKNKILYFVLFILVLIAVGFLLRPGIYSIQPTNAVPDGMTIIYVLRDADVPFYTSLHPECAYSSTNISLMCTAMLRTAFENLSGRILFRLPYNQAAYLKGSGGVEPGYIEVED